MSLKNLSKHIAAHGRHGDSELVHVSKEELKTLHGLASLQGTHLTTNPHTGLTEAFSLGGLFKTVLPIAAGIGGAAVGMPWLGALASAGSTTAETGSLSKGLMAGMGSYALGNLGGAALGAGNQALASGAADAASQAGTQAATQAAATGMPSAAANAVGEAASQNAGNLAGQFSAGDLASMAGQQGMGNAGMQQSLGQSFPSLSADQLAQVTSEGTPDLMAQRAAMLDRFGQANYTLGANGAVSQAAPIGGSFNPSMMDKLGALNGSDYLNIAKDNPGAVLGTGTMLMNSLTPDPKKAETNEWDGGMLARAHVVPDYYTRNSRQFASGGLASLSPKFACGGMVAFDEGGQVPGANAPGMGNEMYPQANVQSTMYNQPTQAPMERSVLHSGYEQMTDPNTGDQLFAHGGLAMLRQGRAIRGPGDGMSDDVPASIGGVEPARLADGEYVIPADAVSHIGNGSTDAGVRKLDGMMSRIRKARTGTPKQGKQIKPEKYMPA